MSVTPINKRNFLPTFGNRSAEKIPVYWTFWNSLVTANNTISIDTIAEKTLNSGVTIDGVLIKDGIITGTTQTLGTASAYSGGGQANATSLSESINIVDTVAAQADSVKLPAGVSGDIVVVINADDSNPYNSVAIFPQSGESINGTTNGNILVPYGENITFYATANGTWISNKIYFQALTVGAQEVVADSNTVTTNTYFTKLYTTVPSFPIIDSGKYSGQTKKILFTADGGDSVLTFPSLAGGTTITFSDVGDTVELYWTGTTWIAYALYNIVNPALSPTLA